MSDVIGSWKIMAEPVAAQVAQGPLGSAGQVPALEHDAPDTAAWPFGRRPMTASDVTLLPQPDSPTMPRVRPAATEKPTPSTRLGAAPSWPGRRR